MFFCRWSPWRSLGSWNWGTLTPTLYVSDGFGVQKYHRKLHDNNWPLFRPPSQHGSSQTLVILRFEVFTKDVPWFYPWKRASILKSNPSRLQVLQAPRRRAYGRDRNKLGVPWRLDICDLNKGVKWMTGWWYTLLPSDICEFVNWDDEHFPLNVPDRQSIKNWN